MKAVRVHEYGGPEQLRLEEVPQPKAQSGQVLVRISASSVNPIDYKLGSGVMRQIMPIKFPWIPGGDFSGTVEEVGPGVTGLKKGDTVYGDASGGGAYAEFYAGPVTMIARKPQKLGHVEAASVPLAGQTAWQGLFDHGRLARGDRFDSRGGRRRRIVCRATRTLERGHGVGDGVRGQCRLREVSWSRFGHRLQGDALRVGGQECGPRLRPDRRRHAATLVSRSQTGRSSRGHITATVGSKRPPSTTLRP